MQSLYAILQTVLLEYITSRYTVIVLFVLLKYIISLYKFLAGH